MAVFSIRLNVSLSLLVILGLVVGSTNGVPSYALESDADFVVIDAYMPAKSESLASYIEIGTDDGIATGSASTKEEPARERASLAEDADDWLDIAKVSLPSIRLHILLPKRADTASSNELPEASQEISTQLSPEIDSSTAPHFSPVPTNAPRDEMTSTDIAVAPAPTYSPLPRLRPVRRSELKCLTEALYFEARGESRAGQIGVAEVIINRRNSKRYPDTVCDVVYQGAEKGRACQFSYACDGIKETITDMKSYNKLQQIAYMMLRDYKRLSLTDGALNYHTDYVSPRWALAMHRTTVIGSHIFYRPPANKR